MRKEYVEQKCNGKMSLMNEVEFLEKFQHLRNVQTEQDYPLRRVGKKRPCYFLWFAEMN